MLSIAKMLSGWNAFEISDIQELQLSHHNPGDQDVTMLHWVENRQMEFLRSTG
jgi:hypothetical protein